MKPKDLNKPKSNEVKVLVSNVIRVIRPITKSKLSKSLLNNQIVVSKKIWAKMEDLNLCMRITTTKS